MDTLNIDKEKAINAYRVGSDEQKQVLELLFGVETLKPKTVMDRVKTFEDALKELKPFHPLVKEYKALCKADVTSNLIAYSKLCIVTAALNEGWIPKFIKGEKRYSPCFFLIPIKRLGTCRKRKIQYGLSVVRLCEWRCVACVYELRYNDCALWVSACL